MRICSSSKISPLAGFIENGLDLSLSFDRGMPLRKMRSMLPSQCNQLSSVRFGPRVTVHIFAEEFLDGIIQG